MQLISGHDDDSFKNRTPETVNTSPEGVDNSPSPLIEEQDSDSTETTITIAERLLKDLKNWKRHPIISAVSIIVTIIGGLTIVGINIKGGTKREPKPPTVTTTTLITPSPTTRMARIDGVDLQRYCDYFHFTAPDDSGKDVTCYADINLVDACAHEHPGATHFLLQDPTNPKTGRCYDQSKNSLGGISNMSGYCQTQHVVSGKSGNNPVHADAIGLNWQCRMTVNVTAACIGTHNDTSLKAINDGREWGCYKPE